MYKIPHMSILDYDMMSGTPLGSDVCLFYIDCCKWNGTWCQIHPGNSVLTVIVVILSHQLLFYYNLLC
jgi:hypothetical protein